MSFIIFFVYCSEFTRIADVHVVYPANCQRTINEIDTDRYRVKLNVRRIPGLPSKMKSSRLVFSDLVMHIQLIIWQSTQYMVWLQPHLQFKWSTYSHFYIFLKERSKRACWWKPMQISHYVQFRISEVYTDEKSTEENGKRFVNTYVCTFTYNNVSSFSEFQHLMMIPRGHLLYIKWTNMTQRTRIYMIYGWRSQ